MKNVIVCGGAGFIGSNLVDELAKLKEIKRILIIDDMRLGRYSNIQTTYCNAKTTDDIKIDLWKLRVETAFNKLSPNVFGFEPDTIFNLAVDPLPKSLEKPREVWNNNIDIVWAIASYCRHHETKMVNFSSSEVYGTEPMGLIDESHVLVPTTPYAASKAACDHLIDSLVRVYGLNVTTIRPFNVIGPRQNAGSYAGIIPKTIRRIQNKERPIIFGTGKQTRDYTYVTDIARAAIDVANKGEKGEVYNACSGRETTIEWLIEEICENMGYHSGIEYRPERVADVKRHQGNCSKLRSLTGWVPEIDIREAVKKTVESYA